MFCSNCGSRIPDGSNFCTKCGKKQDLGSSGNTQDQSRVDQTVYNQSANRGNNHYHSASFSEAEDRYWQSKGNRSVEFGQTQYNSGQAQYNSGQAQYNNGQTQRRYSRRDEYNNDVPNRYGRLSGIYTKRNPWIVLLLGLVTCNVYNIIIGYQLLTELDDMLGDTDNSRIPETVCLALGTFVPFLTLVWGLAIANRLQRLHLVVYGSNKDFTAEYVFMSFIGVLMPAIAVEDVNRLMRGVNSGFTLGKDAEFIMYGKRERPYSIDAGSNVSAGAVIGIIIAVLAILGLVWLATKYPSYYKDKKQNEMIEESLQNDEINNDSDNGGGEEEKLTTSTREAQTYESEESTEESTESSAESIESTEEYTEISDGSTEASEDITEEHTEVEEPVVSEFNAVKDSDGGLVVHGNSDDMDGSVSKSSQSIEEFKASCKVYNYEDLIRYSDSYVGEPVKVTVKVSNKFNDPEYYWSCNAATSTGWYGDSYTLNYNSEPKLVQGDVVVAYGTYMGSIDTWTVLNVRNEVPTIDVVCIDILTEDEANDIIQDMWNAEFNSYQ